MNCTTNRCIRYLILSSVFSGIVLAAQTSSAQSTSDRSFVQKALEGGNAEVQLGQLASQKAQSDDVKQFGQKMVTDHTQLGDQLKPIAQQLNVSAPSGLAPKDKMLYTKLQGLSGSEFDREYIKAMVKDHEQDLKEFRNEAGSTQNRDLKQAVQQGASVISQHLEMIQQIAKRHHVEAEAGKTTASSE